MWQLLATIYLPCHGCWWVSLAVLDELRLWFNVSLSLIEIMELFLSTFATPFLYKKLLKFQQVAFGVRFENHHRLLPVQGIATFGCCDSNRPNNYNNNVKILFTGTSGMVMLSTGYNHCCHDHWKVWAWHPRASRSPPSLLRPRKKTQRAWLTKAQWHSLL